MRTPRRHDFSLEPPSPNYLERLRAQGVTVHGVGKISDIFAGRDVDSSRPTTSNGHGIAVTTELLRTLPDHSFVFTNLVETDMLWGHRNDPRGFADALEEFDAGLPDILAALRHGDLLVLTSDHGCDPTTPSTDHSREHALLLAHVPGAPLLSSRHDGDTFADVGATVHAGAHPRARTRPARHAGAVSARIVDLIARKRDGGELTAAELAEMISPETPDYQLAAFLMAVVLRGMSGRETADLMTAMVASGARLDLSSVGRPVADKHSTGGVGDKTTLVVAPLVAACGVPVAKLSGRGLGHTGGTLDKLESIPGFEVDLEPGRLVEQVRRVGVAVAGPDRRSRAGRPAHVRAARRHGDGAEHPPDRHQHHVEEGRRRCVAAGARRQGGGGRVHARCRAGARARRRHDRARRGGGPADDLHADAHGRAAGQGGRKRARGRRGGRRALRARPGRPGRPLRDRGGDHDRRPVGRRACACLGRGARDLPALDRRPGRRSRRDPARPRPRSLRCRRRGTATCARATRWRWARRRCAWAPAGRARRTSSTTRWASWSMPRPGSLFGAESRLPRCTPALPAMSMPQAVAACFDIGDGPLEPPPVVIEVIG